MRNSFKFENLERKMIKEVLYHLTDKDKFNLLICCKEWNKAITLILWGDITPSSYYNDNRKVKEAYKKYGHYIKTLDLRSYSDLLVHFSIYPNSTKLYIYLGKYLKKRNHLKNIPLTGLTCTTFIDGMTTKTCILVNKIHTK
ncbi:hypothetical protein K502DRAFT_163714 [Neoconidiobolus thromboides FSU 785]|nr:hypothetical protein K502DRAFT_163714 [Neoconidiobolus thromboides FSU 785]